ncbi:amidase [Rhodopseudomonas sp. WA056]|uniref:amidase n=1 Tax=Rhodopseudomonas sp. WA056 TaxID=2269367 RepID=UPI0013DEF610|nr:amidase [Rhodopseudomonas sp. WA056]NEW86382.1 amidase [Rhodopseudomonas sp. WA056]
MSYPLGLLAVHRAFREGTLSPADYLATCIQRADEVEPWLKAFCHRLPADQLAGGEGPLAGVPIGVKDIIATAGIPTTNGSRVYADHVPDQDAPIVTRIKQLGGIVFGKTVSTEFAWRSPGPTVNPHNPQHTPGGSSSGSAAAVAAGIVPMALGTQTVGSIVRPAAYCGVVGFKPSFGAIVRDGVHPLAQSLDHVGFLTRSVADAAFAFGLLADGADAAGAAQAVEGDVLPAMSSLRLGVVRPPIWDRVSAEQNQAFETALEKLRRAGASVEPLALPERYWQGFEAAEVILAAEAATIFDALVTQYPELTSPQLKELVAAGNAISAPRYIWALQLQASLREELPRHLSGLDGILTVPAPGEAPEGLTYTGDASFCALWTMLGVPALTMPIARSARGLPLGLQVIGGFGEDAKLLRTARVVEAQLAN